MVEQRLTDLQTSAVAQAHGARRVDSGASVVLALSTIY
jgi:hypothetical protein